MKWFQSDFQEVTSKSKFEKSLHQKKLRKLLWMPKFGIHNFWSSETLESTSHFSNVPLNFKVSKVPSKFTRASDAERVCKHPFKFERLRSTLCRVYLRTSWQTWQLIRELSPTELTNSRSLSPDLTRIFLSLSPITRISTTQCGAPL